MTGARGGLLAVMLMAGALGLEGQERHAMGAAAVAIYNLAGEAEVVQGEGDEVVVFVTRGGADGERLEVEVVERDGRATLVVHYPATTVVYPRPQGGNYTIQMTLGSDGTWGDAGWRDWIGAALRREGRVRLRNSGSGLEAHADLRIEVPRGGAIDLFVGAGRVAARGVDGDLGLSVRNGGVEVTDVRGDVMLDTGSGAVRAAGVEGALEVDTGSGSVTVERVRGPALHIDTGSGQVTASDVEAEVVEVDTGSGSVRLAGVAAAEVLVDTGSGSVEAELLAQIDRVEIDTGSGAITLRVPGGIGAEIEADSGSGGVEVDLDARVERADRTSFVGTVGDGRGRVTLDTGSGRIRVVAR